MNKEQEQNLQKIYSSLSSAMKEDSHETKLVYTATELPLGIDYQVVNERLMHTRLKKVNTLKDLHDNWTDFQEKYQNDPIMQKIGIEMAAGKFSFDAKTLKDIKEYPSRKQVLYYFKKGEEVKINVAPEDYSKFESTILKSLGDLPALHTEQKKHLVNLSKELMADKSQKTLNILAQLTDGTHKTGKIELPYGNIPSTIYEHILNNNFEVKEHHGKAFIQIPIKSATNNDGNMEKNDHITLVAQPTLQKNGKTEWTLESIAPGNIAQNTEKFALSQHNNIKDIQQRMASIRETSFKPTEGFQPPKLHVVK